MMHSVVLCCQFDGDAGEYRRGECAQRRSGHDDSRPVGCRSAARRHHLHRRRRLAPVRSHSATASFTLN